MTIFHRQRLTEVPLDLELTEEEIVRMEPMAFRAMFRVRRDPLPRAIVVKGRRHE